MKQKEMSFEDPFAFEFSEEEESQILEASEKRKLGVEPAHALMRGNKSEHEYICYPFMRKPSLGMLHAPSGVGKTYYALALSYAISTGTPFLNYQIPAQRRVVYVDGEVGRDIIVERLNQIRNATPTPTEPMLDIAHVDMFDGDMPSIANKLAQERVYEPIVKDADVIVLDNEKALARPEDSKDDECQMILRMQQWFKKLKSQGKSVLLIHHSRKSLNDQGAVEQMGSSNRVHPLDYSIALQKMQGLDDKPGFSVTFDKSRYFYSNDRKYVSYSVDNDCLKWHEHDIDLINSGRVKEAYAALKKWNDVASYLKLPMGYINELRVKYEIDTHDSKSTDLDKMWSTTEYNEDDFF